MLKQEIRVDILALDREGKGLLSLIIAGGFSWQNYDSTSRRFWIKTKASTLIASRCMKEQMVPNGHVTAAPCGTKLRNTSHLSLTPKVACLSWA